MMPLRTQGHNLQVRIINQPESGHIEKKEPGTTHTPNRHPKMPSYRESECEREREQMMKCEDTLRSNNKKLFV